MNPQTPPQPQQSPVDQPQSFGPQSQVPPQQVIHTTVVQQQPGQVRQGNGMAVAGFVLAFFFAPLGLILSAIGLQKSKRLNGEGQGLAIAGLVISILAMLPFFLLFMALLAAGAATETTTALAAGVLAGI